MKDKQPKTAKKEAPKEALKKEDKPKAYVRRPRSKKKPGEIAAFGLHSLKTPRGAHKKKKYLGRGPSSGHGKTSTRGSKGQTSRSGRHFYLGFEGGQSPLIRRFPKRGFVSNFKKVYQIINLSDLNRVKETLISPEVMEDKGLIKHKDRLIKILGDGEIKNAVTVQAHAFSRQAQEKIQKAGGKTELINVQAR